MSLKKKNKKYLAIIMDNKHRYVPIIINIIHIINTLNLWM